MNSAFQGEREREYDRLLDAAHAAHDRGDEAGAVRLLGKASDVLNGRDDARLFEVGR